MIMVFRIRLNRVYNDSFYYHYKPKVKSHTADIVAGTLHGFRTEALFGINQ